MSLRTSGEQRIPREVRGIFLHVLYYLYGGGHFPVGGKFLILIDEALSSNISI